MYRQILGRARTVSLSGDERWLAVVLDAWRVRVVNLEHEAEPVALDGDRVDAVALSRDGEWAVTTCSHVSGSRESGVHLWNARTGTLLKDLWPDSLAATAVFSADGQHLAVRTGREIRCWKVDSWNQPAWSIPGYASDDPGAITFTPDGRLFSIRRSSLALQLLDAATGREVVTLQAPRHARPGPACFSRDGTQLFESNEGFLAVWNLRRIRTRLADLGLDWDQPAYPPAPRHQGARPLTIDVDYGDQPDSSAAASQ
jgi:WD40 repeat protein